MEPGTRITMGLDSRLLGNDMGVEIASLLQGSIFVAMTEEG